MASQKKAKTSRPSNAKAAAVAGPSRTNAGTGSLWHSLCQWVPALQEHRGSSRSRKSLPLEEPDVSRILKVAESNQLEEAEDSFDHPLHSTAVDADGEEPSKHEPLGRVSGPQRKSAERSEKRRRSGGSGVAVRKPSADESLQKAASASKFHATKRPSQSTPNPSAAGPCSVQLWCPNELKRTSRDVTELDVVLSEFEKVAATYSFSRQSRESDVCRKAVDGFCAAFRSQITDLIAEAQELEEMKRKNAKIMRDIQKKQQQLFQLRAELIRAEPQLTRLQREYAELQERKASVRQATQLLADLKELQADCANYRKENPEEAAVYGRSSLPALLVESRRVLGAERHFHHINLQLEKALAVRRGELAAGKREEAPNRDVDAC